MWLKIQLEHMHALLSVINLANMYAIRLCKTVNIDREARNSGEQNLRTLPLFSIRGFKMISASRLRICLIFEAKLIEASQSGDLRGPHF